MAELAVTILWHMHQPDYRDPVSGRSLLPWVRLHALLSYYDMIRLARETEETRVVVNVVPSLLRQLEWLTTQRAEDDFLLLARAAPGDLGERERLSLLRWFFSFHHGRRFPELPRLGELWRKREALGPRLQARAATAFSDAELRDLQVGFHLAWCGRTLRDEPLVRALMLKGRGFAEAEKSELLDTQRDFLLGVLTAYRDFAADGVGEISCTPFAHPILPLICDLQSAHETAPGLPLPAARFARPGDAWYHVETALAETERLLGVRPHGMWPAEGSISEQAADVLAAAGVRWIASDQDVLAATLAGRPTPVGWHFQAFRRVESARPLLFFRDTALSDRIGFVYAGWQPERAAADFVAHLQRIRAGLPAGRWLVPIILDGENAWEAYPNNGVEFLRGLYKAVAETPGLRWRTFSDFLAAGGEEAAAPLSRIRAGSWIRRDFTTWIGHPVKNLAWERLASTRDWLDARLAEGGALRRVALPGGAEVDAPSLDVVGPDRDTPLARAWQAMIAAEASDWFWWYGDDHPTDFAEEFDRLFRTHLQNVYRLLGAKPPPILDESLLARRAAPRARSPRGPLEVVLDGRVSNYFEWLDAGQVEDTAARGAMHQAIAPVAALHFGGDAARLLLRLDPQPELGLAGMAGLSIYVRPPREGAAAVVLRLASRPEADGRWLAEPNRGDGDDRDWAGLEGIGDRVLELAVPWAMLGATSGQELSFFITLERDGQVELRLPTAGVLNVRVPVGEVELDDWIV